MSLEDLKIEDLYIECQGCRGTGHYSGPPTPQGGSGFGSHLVWEERACRECNGRGGQVTKAGQVVLEFLRIANHRHLL